MCQKCSLLNHVGKCIYDCCSTRKRAALDMLFEVPAFGFRLNQSCVDAGSKNGLRRKGLLFCRDDY